ncbi:von Willebrand factor type A domain-containing protein [Shewanella sp. UCD-KL21]|uniref:YfbK domain-containing protein n=1 Tax=Shewanella sp. UCD-KL21 TaxID=1917164 RepID=UPI000970740A|nr:von Willebrand factor type A domain-containing protein [Shewanella sp. UCD-KL21]
MSQCTIYQACKLSLLLLVSVNGVAQTAPQSLAPQTLASDTIAPQTIAPQSLAPQISGAPRLQAVVSHGGNMVSGETPLSQLTFNTDNNDYDRLKHLLNQQIWPEKNTIQSQNLLNAFQYDFSQYQPLSESYQIHTELAPSPYNNDTLLLLINIKPSDMATEPAKQGLAYLQAKLRFNPRLIAEYRLIGFERNYGQPVNKQMSNGDTRLQTQTQAKPKPCISAKQTHSSGQYSAMYELRLNESYSYEASNSGAAPLKPIAPQQANAPSAQQRFSIENLARLSLYDMRLKSQHALLGQLDIKIAQQDKFFQQASDEFRFAAAVAGLGQLINQNNYVHGFDYPELINIAHDAKGADSQGERSEFIALVKQAMAVSATNNIGIKKPHQRHNAVRISITV